MTREEAIELAHKALCRFPQPYYTGTDFVPHEWVIMAIIEAANNASPAPSAESSMGAAVLGMRDTFLQLVAAYNHVGHYTHARDAQSMAIVLHTFEAEHNLTTIAWPLQLIDDEERRAVRGVEGEPLTDEDL